MNSSMAFENFSGCHAFTATIIFKGELLYFVVIRWFTKKILNFKSKFDFNLRQIFIKSANFNKIKMIILSDDNLFSNISFLKYVQLNFGQAEQN